MKVYLILYPHVISPGIMHSYASRLPLLLFMVEAWGWWPVHHMLSPMWPTWSVHFTSDQCHFLRILLEEGSPGSPPAISDWLLEPVGSSWLGYNSYNLTFPSLFFFIWKSGLKSSRNIHLNFQRKCVNIEYPKQQEPYKKYMHIHVKWTVLLPICRYASSLLKNLK